MSHAISGEPTPKGVFYSPETNKPFVGSDKGKLYITTERLTTSSRRLSSGLMLTTYNSSLGRPACTPFFGSINFCNLTNRTEETRLSTAIFEMLSIELAAGEKLRVIAGDEVARANNEVGQEHYADAQK